MLHRVTYTGVVQKRFIDRVRPAFAADEPAASACEGIDPFKRDAFFLQFVKNSGFPVGKLIRDLAEFFQLRCVVGDGRGEDSPLVLEERYLR